MENTSEIQKIIADNFSRYAQDRGMVVENRGSIIREISHPERPRGPTIEMLPHTNPRALKVRICEGTFVESVHLLDAVTGKNEIFEKVLRMASLL